MKIIFLGTSHGVPSAKRYCACNMIEVNGSRYIIDAGAPLADLLLRRHIPFGTIRAFFNTHLHGDHINGLFAFVDLINWHFKDASLKIHMTEEKGIRLLQEMLSAEDPPMETDRLQFRMVREGMIYEDENIRVTAWPNQHLARRGCPSYSYLIEAEGKRVIFSGDLSHHLAGGDFPRLALEEPIDLLVMEMAHFSVDEIRPYLDRCQTQRVLFTHVFPEEKTLEINALDGQYPYPIHAVEDDDEIVL